MAKPRNSTSKLSGGASQNSRRPTVPSRASAGGGSAGSTSATPSKPKQQFGYDAISDSPRRKSIKVDLRSEDDLLKREDRAKLISTARDMRRNFAIAAWMIRQHLNFVSDFSFEANTPDQEFNRRLKRRVVEWSAREQCDVARRHPLRRLIRMSEGNRTLDGDQLVIKLKAGSIQLVRGDRIRTPRDQERNKRWVQGVQLDAAGGDLAYAIHNRNDSGGYVFDRTIPAANAILHGYFDDSDQVRGVSPLASALNSLRDVYENIDYALARAKISQLFGLLIKRAADDDMDSPPPYDPEADEDEESDDAEGEDGDYDMVEYGKGPFQLETKPGDDAKFLESAQPSTQFKDFNADVILLALKALDLPYSFYREDFTNFFGSRGALQIYKRSARHKQQDNEELLDDLTLWKLRQWVLSGEIELPRGWTVDDIGFTWVPRGIEWWDKSKEIVGDLRAIGAGLDNPQRICRDHGSGDFYENCDEIGKALDYVEKNLAKYGFKLSFDPGSSEVVVQEAANA